MAPRTFADVQEQANNAHSRPRLVARVRRRSLRLALGLTSTGDGHQRPPELIAAVRAVRSNSSTRAGDHARPIAGKPGFKDTKTSMVPPRSLALRIGAVPRVPPEFTPGAQAPVGTPTSVAPYPEVNQSSASRAIERGTVWGPSNSR